jgi:RNA-binding protein YlmH
VVAKVFSLSRDEAARLFHRGLVFLDGSLCESLSKIPKEGQVVSVRGKGRFIYLGYETLTKKGKKNIEVDLYV